MEMHNSKQFSEGCHRVAYGLGIRIENFWIGENSLTAKRLNDILYRRGSQGAILLPTGVWREKMNHAWKNLATVSFGIYNLTPSTDRVKADHYGNMEKSRRKRRKSTSYTKVDHSRPCSFSLRMLRNLRGHPFIIYHTFILPVACAGSNHRFDEFPLRRQNELNICIWNCTVLKWIERMSFGFKTVFTQTILRSLLRGALLKKLTHIDKQGRARMADVTGKPATKRVAIAKGSIFMKPETLQLIGKMKHE